MKAVPLLEKEVLEVIKEIPMGAMKEKSTMMERL